MNKDIIFTPVMEPASCTIYQYSRIEDDPAQKNLAISTTEQPNPNQWLFKLYNMRDETDYIFLDPQTLLNLMDLIDTTDYVEVSINDFDIKINTEYRQPTHVKITKKNPKTITVTPKPGFFTTLFDKKPYKKIAPGEEIYCIFPRSATDRVRDLFFYSEKRHHKKFHKEISYED